MNVSLFMSWGALGKRAVREFGEYATQRYDRPVHRFASKAADWFQSVTGFGDYNVNNNTLMTDNAPPMFTSSGTGIRVCHREYLGDISGSSAFTLESYPINPGMHETFPWLAQVASNFEQFKLHGCIFEFRSTSADALNSTNTALGTILMATDYDVYDASYASKADMAQAMFTCSGPPSRSLFHPIECDPSQLPTKLLYLRSGQIDTDGRDLRFYDIGNFQIATVGMQAASVIGELWVTYDVEFFKPQPTNQDGSLVNYVAECTSYTNALPLFSGVLVVADGSRTDLVNIVSATQIAFTNLAAGKKFVVQIIWTGTAALFGAPSVTLTGLTNVGSDFSTNIPQSGGAVSASTASIQRVVIVGSAGGTLDLGVGVLPSSGTLVRVRITQALESLP